MNKQLFLLLSLIAAACGPKEAPKEGGIKKAEQASADTSNAFTLTTASETDFIPAQKINRDQITPDTSEHKKDNGKIILPIDNNPNQIMFRDTLSESDESSIEEYKYAGQFRGVGIYVVQGSFYESSEYYLIDKTQGQKTAIWGWPEVSPKKSFIADISMSYGMEGEPNGLQVWRLEKKRGANCNFKSYRA